MKVCLLSYMFRRFPLEKAFEVCSELGYDGVEIWGGRPHAYPWDMDEKKIDEILALKERYRLETPVYCAEVLNYPYNPCTTDPKERRETIDYLKQALTAASRFGAPRVLMAFDHAGFGTTRRQNQDNVVGVLKEVCAHAEKVGVDLMAEPVTIMESNVGATADDVAEIIERVGSPRLTSMLDVATPFAHFEPYGEFLTKLKGKVSHVHFQDNDGVSPAHLPLGEGCLPLEDLVDILKKYGYDGYLCVELLWPELRDPELYARKTIRSLKAILND